MSDETEMPSPSPTASNGRGADGKFTSGNKIAKGNPHAAKIQRLRSALLRAVSPADIKQAVRKLVELAKAGDVRALTEILDRTIGRPLATDTRYIHEVGGIDGGAIPIKFDTSFDLSKLSLEQLKQLKAIHEALANESAIDTSGQN